ncbi:zinc ribbon-containing protein [Phyllobacterium zundukense]|uniref:zinc ribbon-containing protein n=1 Tax=Phyllobacterium zundukense TaxID=1867719 RepID=UPI0021C9503B|nr:zinc ribbon-containing protein [Phyllobacterium zundukense]
MQRSLDSAVRQLNGQDLSDDEINTLARFVRAAFIIGNRDMESMARFAVKAVLIRRKSRAKTQL